MNDSVNKITAKKKCRSAPSCIEAKDGSIIRKKDKILERWEEYMWVTWG